jgi:hypothetical protein
MKRLLTLGLIAAALLFGACAKESSLPNPTGTGTIRALNAIPNSPEVAFLIEERLLGSVRTKETSNPAEYDDLDYTFNFDTVLAGDITRTRVASQFLDVQADVDYTLVISGAIDAPDVAVWEADRREWGETETIFELSASHLSPSLGLVDIYITDLATPPALGSQFATLGSGEVSASAELEAGDYVVTVTPAGDDATILFVSDTVTIGSRTQILLSLFDIDGNDLAPVSVRLFNLTGGGSSAVSDSRIPPQARFIHASLDLGDADIYVDDPLTTPLVANHMFKDVTAFVDITADVNPITYTTAGNIGSILVDEDVTIPAGTRTDFHVVTLQDDTDVLITSISDRRSNSTVARLAIIYTANERAAVDVYIVPSGELIDEATPLLAELPLGVRPVGISLLPNSYDIYVTVEDEKVILAGPVPLVANAGDVFEAVIFENVDPNILDLAFIPLP